MYGSAKKRRKVTYDTLDPKLLYEFLDVYILYSLYGAYLLYQPLINDLSATISKKILEYTGYINKLYIIARYANL